MAREASARMECGDFDDEGLALAVYAASRVS